MNMKKPLIMAATLVAALGASQVFADHGRRVVVRESHYSAPVLSYHSGPVSVYVGPTHSTRVITTSHRHNAHRYNAFGHQKHHGHKSRKHHRYNHKHRHGGSQRAHYGRHYDGHAPTRGSWSRDRREVIYVNKDARRHSNYRRVERNSVVIRERRR